MFAVRQVCEKCVTHEKYSIHLLTIDDNAMWQMLRMWSLWEIADSCAKFVSIL